MREAARLPPLRRKRKPSSTKRAMSSSVARRTTSPVMWQAAFASGALRGSALIAFAASVGVGSSEMLAIVSPWDEFDALEEVPILLVELARDRIDNVRAQGRVSGCCRHAVKLLQCVGGSFRLSPVAIY